MSKSARLCPHVLRKFSVCVIGNQNVGKSSIIERFANSSFSENYVPTIGIDFESSVLELDNAIIQINIHDISGQSKFLPCAREQIETADAFIYVYDITDKDSFNACKRWHGIVNQKAKSLKLPKLLLGNRLDLRHKQAVSAIDAKEFAIPEGMKHIEVSAKTGKNVSAAFFILANDIISFRRLGGHEQIGVIQTDPDFVLRQIEKAPEVQSVADTSDYAHVFRILLVGAPRSGKSAIRLRFCKNYFSPNYYASAGLECSTRSLLIDGQKVKIQVWDVSGDDIYTEIRRSYYRGANGFIITYDVTNKNSFENADHMIKELDMLGQSECPKVVLGNKSDLSAKQQISHSAATEWANGWRIPLIEVSAKNGANVDGAFLKILVALKDRLVPWKQVYNFST